MGDYILDVFSKLLKAKAINYGVAPGTISESAEKIDPDLNLIQFNSEAFRKEKITDLSTIKDKLANDLPNAVNWLDVGNVRACDVLKNIGEIFSLHPLVLEDISNLHQRPKFEDNDEYLYLVLNMIRLDPVTKEITKEQVSFIVLKNTLITFQEKPGDVFDVIRKRLEMSRGRIRRMPVDYLLYALLDVVIDNYFIVLNSISEKINKLSLSIDKHPDNQTISEVQKLKQKLLNLVKYITPTKELVWNLLKSESDLLNENIEMYFKDLNDHVLQVNDAVDVLRDSLVGLLQYANSIISNKLNEIMKVLTVVSTIFIPLNFIASVYGMNFRHMPELEYQNGYYAVVAGMFSLGLLMFIYFKIRKWI